MEESVCEQICLQNRAQQSLSLSATAGSIQQNTHRHEESMGTALLSDEGVTVCDNNWAVSCNTAHPEWGICRKVQFKTHKHAYTYYISI